MGILEDFQYVLKDRGNVLDKNSRAMKQLYSATESFAPFSREV